MTYLLQKYPIILQFSKFVAVGFLNTAVDFIVLNILMKIFKTYKGGKIFFLNVISFSVATINSYFWNKYWTFQDKSSDAAAQFSAFLLVSVCGAGINSLIVYLVTTKVGPRFGLSEKLWANFAKVLATGVSLIWNFIGYKIFVFRV